jgi:prolyl oligopeptidase
VIIDVDQLAADEEQNWVWAGASCRYPDYDRCLVGLSIGGCRCQRAPRVRSGQPRVRRRRLQPARIQELPGLARPRQRLLRAGLQAEQMTTSEYPRQIYIWERGTPREEATLVFEGPQSDVLVFPARFWDKDTPYDMIVRCRPFFTREYHPLPRWRDPPASTCRPMPSSPACSTASCWSS